jgi:hypothetical protein
MVRAILDGRKSQTRRIVKFTSALGEPEEWCHKHERAQFSENVGDYRRFCPYGQPGNRLWVRETWNACDEVEGAGWYPYREIPKARPHSACVSYSADGLHDGPWRPSIHMPRWASRITLEITGVRVERLQDISEEDAETEGSHRKIWITSPFSAGAMNATSERGTFRDGYKDIWESINGLGSWAQNPFVWVIEFRRIAQNCETQALISQAMTK